MPSSINYHRARVRQRLLIGCLAIALFATGGSGRAAVVKLTQEIVAGGRQKAVVGQPFRQPFAVVVRGAQGEPVPGAKVVLEINYCAEGLPPPGGSLCPPAQTYGSFSNGGGLATAVADADGRATAPVFTAGSLAGHYQVISWVPEQNIGNITTPYDPSFAFFELAQVAITDDVPALSTLTMTILALGLVVVGAGRLRRIARR